MSELKLLCFDLDDTLWPVEPTIRQAETVFYQVLQELAPALCERFSAQALRQQRLAYLELNPELRHHISRWRVESLIQALRETGHEGTAEAIAEQAFARFLAARQQVTLFDACEEVLQQLAGEYLLIGLTNGNADLTQMPAGRHFQHCFRAEELGFSKPHPALFERALAAAGCTAEQALHVGDHIDDDIAGAKRAGLLAIQARLLPEPAPVSPHADGHFDHWRDLPTIIAGLLRAR